MARKRLSGGATRESAASLLYAELSQRESLQRYAHEFARAEHADRTREQMEDAFGSYL